MSKRGSEVFFEHCEIPEAVRRLGRSGMIAAASNGVITAFNVEAERLLGGRFSLERGRSIDGLPRALREIVDEAARSGDNPPRRCVLLALDPGGGMSARIEVECFVSPDEGRKALTVVLLLYDISQVQRLVEPLQGLERLANVGLLSAGIAHEIKNALSFIQTYTQLLEEGRADPDALSLVQREIQRIDTTSRHLLRVARARDARWSEIHMHRLLQDTLQVFRHRFESQGIELGCVCEATDDTIEGDAQQLELVLTNLCLNAVEAMPNGGRLEVVTCDVGNEGGIEVRVIDTGPGIPEAHLPRLFESFFTTKSGGTGLGLPIASSLVRAHGGTLTAENRPEGGTEFRMRLPTVPVERQV